jgi:hypothetical protein
MNKIYTNCLRNLAGLLILTPAFTNAQVIIGSGASIAASQDTEIAISAPSDLNNGSAFDFSTTILNVDLVGADQSIAGNFVMAELSFSASGTKTMTGNITVTKNLTFTQGILKPLSPSNKFLYTGAEGGLKDGNNDSFFDCTDTGSGSPVFYSNGSGSRLFPIGAQYTLPAGSANLYTPATLEKISGETGMSVVASDPDLDGKDTIEFFSINNQRYWQITDVAPVAGLVTLNLNGLEDYLTKEGTVTVVQADAIAGEPTNIGNSASDNTNIRSSSTPTAPYLTIGKEKKFKIRIHDLITPSGSKGFNDVLTIDYLDKFTFKHVTLLDRWGVLIKEWNDFSEDIAKAYDFNQLGAGNYIVVVEYGKIGEKKMVEQQMVTVLKTN